MKLIVDVILPEQENLKPLSEVKILAPYFKFCNCFREHLLLPKHIFLNALEIEWWLLLSKILKPNGVVVVSLLLTSNIFNT